MASRFAIKPQGTRRAAYVYATPHTSAFTHSMIAQAARVPRLQNLTAHALSRGASVTKGKR
jgi:hypothetical protein